MIPDSIRTIALPLPHIRSVNTWLLTGEPLALVDTGPHDDEALRALERGLRREGVRVEDIELLLVTHHHVDHCGLAATIRARSGARVAALDAVAEYGARHRENVELERTYSHALMASHGVPRDVVRGNEGFWEFLRANGADFEVDVRLADGDDIVAGGRRLTVLERPGHSTTDTLFVDHGERLAFTGDHLLAGVSSNTEISRLGVEGDARPAPRVTYLENLRRTAELPVDMLLTGHGRPVAPAAPLVHARLAEHRERSERIALMLAGRRMTAYDLARGLWSARTVREQPVLVVWEVLGHLELLVADRRVVERVDDDGLHRFVARDDRPAAATS